MIVVLYVVGITVAVATLFNLVWNFLDALWNRDGVQNLARVAPMEAGAAPMVSVVIPACNEELTVEEALQSVLVQNYPQLEVIAVNDRSTDRTGAVLHRMAEKRPILRVIDVTELPVGWLGKNHAMQTGAAVARGEWLLFADADVVMNGSAISRAIAYATENKLDQLAVAPRAIVGGFLSKVFLCLFGLLFSLHTKPWKVRDLKSKRYIGIGAFNLVRASAWRGVNGFVPIALRPDDDLKLGKLLKTSGYRCDFALGAELLTVAWYGSFRAMRDGFLKNMFSVFHYNVALATLACVVEFGMFVWPFLAVVILRGPLQWLNAAIAFCLFVFTAGTAWYGGIAWWWAFTVPLGGLLHIYLMAHSTIVNLRDGAITWRGTKYPLELLRTNRF